MTALYYYYNQSTAVTIGSGIRFTFDRVSYTDVPLESGKVYRVFIRLYSGADTPVREREGRRGRGGEKEKGSEREGGRKREEGGREKEREREGERERREGGRKRGGGREKERGGRELSLKEDKQYTCTF